MLSPNLPWDLAKTKWSLELNPIIVNPLTNPLLIKNINLVSGSNVINHGLGRLQQGWIVTDAQGSATVYRDQPFTKTTLSLHSSGSVTISLAVF